MKRKRYQPGLFDTPAWEQEAAARAVEAPMPPFLAYMGFEAGAEQWVSARAAVLVKLRGMNASEARIKAEAEFASFSAEI